MKNLNRETHDCSYRLWEKKAEMRVKLLQAKKDQQLPETSRRQCKARKKSSLPGKECTDPADTLVLDMEPPDKILQVVKPR